MVATGQMAGKEFTEKSAKTRTKVDGPVDGHLVRIFIWDATTCKQIGAPLNGIHRRAIQQLQFSPDGKKLLTIGRDDKNTMVIYDVDKRNVIG